jgi:hypothetical protein
MPDVTVFDTTVTLLSLVVASKIRDFDPRELNFHALVTEHRKEDALENTYR